MEKYIYPPRSEWNLITARPHIDTDKLQDTVRTILEDVRLGGDRAVMCYEEKFDHAVLDSLIVTADEIDAAVRRTPEELLDALTLAHDNIAKFHASQRMETRKVETVPGVECWQKSVPIEKVGLYVPGGTAPLFSTVLMLATPANIAGCGEIVMCTPPGKDGTVNPAILAAAKIAGVHKIFKAGGVQAIAAMAYGTESVPRVYKIFGPGNRYVMAAKQMVSLQDVAIDMPAGPSEVCIMADDTSNPAYVAADLLSQAEHGTDSQVMLITTSKTLAASVENQLEAQLMVLPRRDIAAKALENSKVVIVKDMGDAVALGNMYAPEHLIIATDDCFRIADMVTNAGSVFLGKYACESAGDYASGTNHTLPTHGYATAYSGVNLDSFIRKITFQHLTDDGIRNIGRAVEVMADKEGLYAHKNAMTLRIKDILNN